MCQSRALHRPAINGGKVDTLDIFLYKRVIITDITNYIAHIFDRPGVSRALLSTPL